MRSNSAILREAIETARQRPQDAGARANVARAWLGLGKPRVAMTWAREAYRLDPRKEHEFLLRGIAHLMPPTKTETWEIVGTSLIGPPRPVKLESQLNALFGGELLGEPTRFEVVQRRPLRPRRRMATALLLAAIAIGLAVFGLVAGELRSSRERALIAHDLGGFLKSGALREADEALDRARLAARQPEHARMLAPLMARAEGTLYRYVDRSEERRTNVEALLASSGEGTFDGALARALITPDDELTELQVVLQTIAEQGRDPEAAFLVAVSLAVSGRNDEADRAFAHALDLEPSHLPHLAEYAVWSKRNRRGQQLDELLDQMRMIDPESPWIGWVEDQIQ